MDNATEAVLNGLASASLAAKIQELEREKVGLEKEMRELKQTVDASSIPEKRLKEMLNDILASEGKGNAALLSIVYRVEVDEDKITVWTLLDANPDGTYDWDEEGVLITHGTPSGV